MPSCGRKVQITSGEKQNPLPVTFKGMRRASGPVGVTASPCCYRNGSGTPSTPHPGVDVPGDASSQLLRFSLPLPLGWLVPATLPLLLLPSAASPHRCSKFYGAALFYSWETEVQLQVTWMGQLLREAGPLRASSHGAERWTKPSTGERSYHSCLSEKNLCAVKVSDTQERSLKQTKKI